MLILERIDDERRFAGLAEEWDALLRDSDVVEETSPPFDTRVRIYSLRAGATAELRSWLESLEERSTS